MSGKVIYVDFSAVQRNNWWRQNYVRLLIARLRFIIKFRRKKNMPKDNTYKKVIL